MASHRHSLTHPRFAQAPYPYVRGKARSRSLHDSKPLKCLRPRPRWRPLYAAGCRRGRYAPRDAETHAALATGLILFLLGLFLAALPRRGAQALGARFAPRRRGRHRTVCLTRHRSSLGGLVFAVVFLLVRHDRFRNQPSILAHRGFDLVGDVGIILEELLGILAALPDALAVVREPST